VSLAKTPTSHEFSNLTPARARAHQNYYCLSHQQGRAGRGPEKIKRRLSLLTGRHCRRWMGFLFSRRRVGFSGEDGRAREGVGSSGEPACVGLRCLIAIGGGILYGASAQRQAQLAAAVGVGFVAPKFPFSPRSGPGLLPSGRAVDPASARLRGVCASAVVRCGAPVPLDPSFLLPQCLT
jgi:hypothetical protein